MSGHITIPHYHIEVIETIIQALEAKGYTVTADERADGGITIYYLK